MKRILSLLIIFVLLLPLVLCTSSCEKAGGETVTLYVYNQTAHNVKFSMYAMSALIVAVILTILLIVNFAGSAADRKSKKGGRA